MVRMAFFDIDGTLWDEREGLPDSAARAVRELKRQGISVCICTGRSLGTIYDEVMELEPDGMIAGGGSYVSLGGQILKNQVFTAAQIETCLMWGRAGISLESQKTIYMNSSAAKLLNAANEKKWKGLTRQEKERAQQAGKIICRDNISTCNPATAQIHKICYWGSTEGFRRFRSHLGSCQVVQHDVWCGTVFYELVPKGCDKGAAVALLCREAGIQVTETIGFGDGKNDVDFLKVTGISVAMENGAQEAKDVADRICEPVNRHGIYRELARQGLIRGEGKEQYDGTKGA